MSGKFVSKAQQALYAAGLAAGEKAATDRLRAAIEALLSDIEGMQEDELGAMWYGPFGEYNEKETSDPWSTGAVAIEWPNLHISAAALRAAMEAK